MISKIYGNFGFVNNSLINVPSNIYMPMNLFEKVISVRNLSVVRNNKGEISGGGISFDEREAEICAFGELIERYSSSFQIDNELVFGT